MRNFDNTGTVNVIEDIAANPSSGGVSADISFEVDRSIYRFESDGYEWMNHAERLLSNSLINTVIKEHGVT